MQADAYIIEHIERNGYGGKIEAVTLEWQGGQIACFDYWGLLDPISELLMDDDVWQRLKSNRRFKQGETFRLGNLRLRVVESNEFSFSDSILVARDGWRARLLALQWPVRREMMRFRIRCVLTAVIWGLAERREGECARWSQIQFIARIQGAFKRLREVMHV